MQIVIKSVGPVETKQGPKASYMVFELGYESNGKSTFKNIMEFQKEVFNVLKGAAVGSVWDIGVEKDKTGKYWNWVSANPSSGKAPMAGNTAASSRNSDKESPEERAAKQVYIVRQSSISSAIAFLAGSGTKGLTPESVIEVAKKFEKFVFGGVEVEKEPSLGEGEPE